MLDKMQAGTLTLRIHPGKIPNLNKYVHMLTSASSSSEEILSTTFTNAKLLLRSIIKAQDYDALFSQNNDPNTGHSILDVQKCLRDAQNSYECRVQFSSDDFRTIAPTTAVPTSKPMTPLGKSKAKARLWLMGLSEKIVHYGNVFDVLAQHHPEYVSLAWGTFKLLFIVSKNDSSTRHYHPP
jgi:hypothetical protein